VPPCFRDEDEEDTAVFWFTSGSLNETSRP
jgi:hypothetical protein